MKKFAVAYVVTQMLKYDRMDIKGDKYECWLGSTLVCSGMVEQASQMHAQGHMDIQIVEAESSVEAQRKVIDKSTYLIRETTAVEIP